MRKNFPGHNRSEEIRGTNKDDTIHGLGGNDKLVGRGGDDRIYGDDGKDKLFGGVGHDTLVGGAGADRFLFKETGDANSDNIRDFKHGSDKIGLDVFAFDQLGLGVVSTDNFVQGTSAQDADDFLIWDSETGKLYYDADGNGSGEQFLLADIRLRGEEKILTADDILVFQPQSGS
jgi:Ca2+-binding RTX toxin-like protein